MRDAWLRAEEMGADTVFTWDHFYPLYGDPEGKHFECWTFLGAMAEVTERVEFGALESAWKTEPAALRKIPILIGGGGEKVTLRIVAERANIWHGFGDPDQAARKNDILDDWCEKVGRDKVEIERSISVRPKLIMDADRYVESGITHLIMGFGGPDSDLGPWRTSSPGETTTGSATKRPWRADRGGPV
jgi:alkanesulfonate monooxygenase SsuD/methylene tetrahydromethanopterin reductase-like flavin-dependent oxidoreductase (luciferase family)